MIKLSLLSLSLSPPFSLPLSSLLPPLFPAHLQAVGDEWVPVVEVVKLSVDAVVVLEVSAVGEVRLEGEAEAVLTQVLHVILDGDLDDLAYGWRKGQVRSG